MRWIIPVLLITAGLTGCIGVGVGDDVTPAGGAAADLQMPELRDGRLHVDVPVPVVLIGFPDASVDVLSKSLDKESVTHAALDLPQSFPPDPEREPFQNLPLLGGSTAPMPIAPMARYDVQAAGADVEAAFAERLADWELSGGELPVYDARALEAFLEEALPEAGHAFDPDAPSIVLVHLDAFDVDVHTWRYDFPLGHLEPVRVFGGRAPYLVMDPSATLNPTRGLVPAAMDRVTGNEPEPYSDRLAAEGEDLDRIAEMVREATHFRILQGSIYPMPLPDCHAVTLVLAYRPTAIGEHAPNLRSAEELFDADAVAGAFSNLTGTTVHVDTKVLMLPVDDPALDAISRGEVGTMDVQRWWITENWEDYWVAHEGCEAYVSFLVHGDAASTPSGIIGIGTYDSATGYRVSLSWVNEALRLLFDEASPVSVFSDDTGVYNWVNYLFTHEVGHTLGMRHPHDVTYDDGGASSNTYEDVWSAMSYSTDGRVIDFGAIDQANFQRNRAGYMIGAAVEMGLEDTPAFQEALAHVAELEWAEASAVLLPHVRDGLGAAHGEDADASPALPGFTAAHGTLWVKRDHVHGAMGGHGAHEAQTDADAHAHEH